MNPLSKNLFVVFHSLICLLRWLTYFVDSFYLYISVMNHWQTTQNATTYGALFNKFHAAGKTSPSLLRTKLAMM
jgi:hypothetical protein